jgi:hypothetical protein
LWQCTVGSNPPQVPHIRQTVGANPFRVRSVRLESRFRSAGQTGPPPPDTQPMCSPPRNRHVMHQTLKPSNLERIHHVHHARLQRPRMRPSKSSRKLAASLNAFSQHRLLRPRRVCTPLIGGSPSVTWQRNGLGIANLNPYSRNQMACP